MTASMEVYLVLERLARRRNHMHFLTTTMKEPCAPSVHQNDANFVDL